MIMNKTPGDVVMQNGPDPNAPLIEDAIATCGWANALFGRVKTVNNKQPDANGNVNVESGGTVKTVDSVEPD